MSANATTDSPAPAAAGLTAVILCGGRGERLRPLTDNTPKPLLPVNGRPMLAYLLDHLVEGGVTEFILCTGYKAGLFEEFARAWAAGPVRVRCLDSGEAAGITERLAAARAWVSGRALVCYADTLADVDVGQLLGRHQALGVPATITVHPYRSAFGIVSLGEVGLVSAFQEKPVLPYWINIGFLLLEPAALRRLSPAVSLPDFLSALAAAGELGAYLHSGGHWTANTYSELQTLAARLREHRPTPEQP